MCDTFYMRKAPVCVCNREHDCIDAGNARDWLWVWVRARAICCRGRWTQSTATDDIGISKERCLCPHIDKMLQSKWTDYGWGEPKWRTQILDREIEQQRAKEKEREKKRTRKKVNIRDSFLYESKIKSCKTHLTHIRLKSDVHTLEQNICSILLFYHLRKTNWFWKQQTWEWELNLSNSNSSNKNISSSKLLSMMRYSPFSAIFFSVFYSLAFGYIFCELILHFCVVGAKDQGKGTTSKSPQG